MKKMSIIYEALIELHAEMVWDQAIRTYREQKIYEEIDSALKHKDQARFYKLTEELNTLKNRTSG